MPDIPTDRELEALKVLWDRGEATVRDVCDTLNSQGEELAYTTVLSLMQVMEQKGLVTHRSGGEGLHLHRGHRTGKDSPATCHGLFGPGVRWGAR